MAKPPQKPQEPRKRRPLPKREPTLFERAAERERAFWAARKAHQENPTAETLEALAKARAARGGHLPEDEHEDRERFAIDLLVGHRTSEAAGIFSDVVGVTRATAREWMLKALESRRLSVAAYRDVAVERLEGLAAEAREAGDYNAAGRAAAQAAKFAGVTEKVEVSYHIDGQVEIEHRAATELFAPFAAHPKLHTASALSGRLWSAPDVAQALENAEAHERAVDAAVDAYHRAMGSPRTIVEARVEHHRPIPTAQPGPSATPSLALPLAPTDDEQRAAIEARYAAGIAELRSRPLTPGQHEGAFDELRLSMALALRALDDDHHPTT